MFVCNSFIAIICVLFILISSYLYLNHFKYILHSFPQFSRSPDMPSEKFDLSLFRNISRLTLHGVSFSKLNIWQASHTGPLCSNFYS